MRAIVVASGDTPGDQDWLRWVRDGDLIIGADGGAARVLDRGLEPDVIIGDMDSLPSRRQEIPEEHRSRLIRHPRAKDETDLELAMTYAVEQGAHEIVVLGALGGPRVDHLLANVLLLALPGLQGHDVRIAHQGQEILLLHAGEAVALHGNPGDLVSLLPVGGDALGVTTAGLAWPLEEATLRLGSSRGVSNEMAAAQASVALREGLLLVLHAPWELAPGAW